MSPTINLEVPVADTEIQAGLHATNYADLQALLNGNLDNSNISSSASLDATARVGVRKNSAGSVFSRRRLNFIEGSGITLTVSDDAGSEEVDVTIASGVASFPEKYFVRPSADVTLSGSFQDFTGASITITTAGTYWFTGIVGWDNTSSGGSDSYAARLVVNGADHGAIIIADARTSGSTFQGSWPGMWEVTVGAGHVAKLQVIRTNGTGGIARAGYSSLSAIRVA